MCRLRTLRSGQRDERGFALLIVLWAAVLLALIGTHITSSGRVEAQLAGNLRANAETQAMADGAVYEAVLHLVDGSDQRWLPDGRTRLVKEPGGSAEIRIDDERAKIDLNGASAALLQALMMRLNVAPDRAAHLAAAILDWRTAVPLARPLGAKEPAYRGAGLSYAPPDSNFERLEELGLVLGMTPDLVHRLAPFLTVYPTGDPDLSVAAPVVLQAVRDAGEITADPASANDSSINNADAVSITVNATGPGGAAVTRRVEVLLGVGTQGRPYQITRWDAPKF